MPFPQLFINKLTHLLFLLSWQWINLFFPWYKPFSTQLHDLTSSLLVSACFLSEYMDLFMKLQRYQFFGLFFRFYYLFFLILNLLLLCYFLSFVFAILAFSVLIFTTFYTSLDILTSLPSLFSSQSQSYSKQDIASSESYSISTL